ncbi:MAG: chromosome segregation protein SMC [Actinomycetota bacterium]|nr:chromosome segregation protein SMC [Actinomycetota bacterium]
MHLSSLTLKGFKSFASSTTLRFEPGMNAVVGPNGSGKSNVVDAISWVLGEQGAKSLRGGKMEDVIFAGTAGRPPLGRAEVTLTIDNTDGALPIEYAEVSITRRMYRSGESEYEINGSSCRLLDIQELLSDTGIGREMHIIVGQGQLDAVLSARPEDRRGFIEEAAGVLKHRKRKEKALRKLDAMQLNLDRVGDLTEELRRQLKPLGRQAEVARRAQSVQADLRDARLRLLADDLVILREALDKELADEELIRSRRSAVDAELKTALAREAELESGLAEQSPALLRSQEVWYQLSALGERLRGTRQLAAQRSRHLATPLPQPPPGRDPEVIQAEAAAVERERFELDRHLVSEQDRLTSALSTRAALEAELRQTEDELVKAARAQADRREGLARLAGDLQALRSRAGAAEDEISRLTAAVGDARTRAEHAAAQFAAVEHEIGELGTSEQNLDARHEAAVAAYEATANEVARLTDAEREIERQLGAWRARAQALGESLHRKDGVGALLAAREQLPGMLGSLSALLRVEPGYEVAVAAALGPIADAIAVRTPRDAAAALAYLRTRDAGRSGVLVGAGARDPGQLDSWPSLPDGARWVRDLVTGPDELHSALARALDRVAAVADIDTAVRLVDTHPRLRVVTAGGDLLGSHWSFGGSVSTPSAIEVQAALEDAQRRHAAAEQLSSQLQADLEAAGALAARRSAAVESALAALHESDAAHSAVAEQLGELGAAARSATAEATRLEQARAAAELARDADLAGLAELERRWQATQGAPATDEPSTAQRDELQRAVAQARQEEMELRLAVRTTEERARALGTRAESLYRAAEQERASRSRQEAAVAARQRGAAIAEAVCIAAEQTLAHVNASLERAAAERDDWSRQKVNGEGELLGVRARLRELAADLDRLTDEVHRDEVARAEQRLRIEALEDRAAQEYGADVDILISEYSPSAMVPPALADVAAAAAEGLEPPEPKPYDRQSQERRASRAERDLALLGKVNPLALEEFAALEERHAFLAAQLEDLKHTKRDLLAVVREVDSRILAVFADAFADVAREFAAVFATLFPGGEGRLILTDPDDLHTTGVEVEARPPGKKVKRLSLLSGGERSLTAVALLVAIFRARPSPFYVLDEIEAALDDVNLRRLLRLIESLRGSSQLIVITHQKQTMEIADTLYGMSMRGDGITNVISQRIRELTSV